MSLHHKVVNERLAQTLAASMGVQPRELERSYGLVIVKERKLETSNWNNGCTDELFYHIGKFCLDKEHCRPFLSRIGIDDITKIRALLELDEATYGFARNFDARLSFDANDRPKGKAGYMIRTEDEFLVSVETCKLEDECERAISGTIIHEYGHYAEQRTIPDHLFQFWKPYIDRDTSFASAIHMLNTLDSSMEDYARRRVADELVAWVNGIWVSWIVGLDPRTAALGAAMDSVCGHKYLGLKVVEQVFDPMVRLICAKKNAAKYFNRFGPYDLLSISKTRFGEDDDMAMCRQIDAATRNAFDAIRERVKFVS